MNKKSISIIAIAILLLTGLVYILVNEFNQPSTDENNATTTAVYQTEISKYLTAMPTITPQPLPTNTPEISPTPTEIVSMYDMFTAEDDLLIYEHPKFDSDVIGSLGVGESAVWAEERKDYSNDPNWNWYHMQFADVEKDENELFDGYVAVLTEQGQQMTQDTCPVVIVDSMNFYSKFPFVATNPGFVGGAGQGYASIETGGYTLGKITTSTYGDAQIDSVNAVIVQLDPNTGSPVLVPFNLVIGVQFNDEQVYHSRMNISGFPSADCISPETCGLDHISQWYPTYGDKTYIVFQNRDETISRFENQIIYGTISGGGFLGTQFNYVDLSYMSYIYDMEFVSPFLSDPAEVKRVSEKFYKLFSQYEIATGDNMNFLFLRGKQVPSDWLNMGFNMTRFFIIPDFIIENDYEQSDLLTQCLQAIGSN